MLRRVTGDYYQHLVPDTMRSPHPIVVMATHNWWQVMAKEVQRASLSVVIREDAGTGAIFGRKVPHHSSDLIDLFLPTEAIGVKLWKYPTRSVFSVTRSVVKVKGLHVSDPR